MIIIDSIRFLSLRAAGIVPVSGGIESLFLLLSLILSVSAIIYMLKKKIIQNPREHLQNDLPDLYYEYAAIYDNMPTGLITIKRDGTIKEYNAEAKKLMEKAGIQTDKFNLFENKILGLNNDVLKLKDNIPVNKKLIINSSGGNNNIYLNLMIIPSNYSNKTEYQTFLVDDTQAASQKEEIDYANAVFNKALVESKIGICRLNLFDHTGFATSTWYDNLYVNEDISIPDSLKSIEPEDYENIENYIGEVKNIQFDEEQFTAFAKNNYSKKISCTVRTKDGKNKTHYLKLYSEISKYDPDKGEITADFIIINIDDQKERETALEQTYLKTKEAEELKQSFISSMSRKINTPLNAITLSCRQLLNNPNPKEEKYLFEKAEINTNKLLKIINDIVTVEVPQKTIYGYTAPPVRNTSEKKTLLIAEDNENNYQLLRYMIRDRYKIVHACTGKEAVNMYKEVKPDAILMDIKMPVMDGYQAAEAIRNIDGSIPIIAVTSYSLDKDKNKILSSGFNDYLSKPVNEKEMFRKLEKYL